MQFSSTENQSRFRSANCAKWSNPDDFYECEVLLDYGLSVSDGNADSLNSRLSGEGMFKHGDHRHIAKLTQIREELDGATTKDQTLISYSYNFMFNDPWFFAANAQVERDPVRELERRLTANAGVGRDNTIVKTMTGFRYEISDLLYLNVCLDWDHESQPAGTAENTDKTFVIGAGLEFE